MFLAYDVCWNGSQHFIVQINCGYLGRAAASNFNPRFPQNPRYLSPEWGGGWWGTCAGVGGKGCARPGVGGGGGGYTEGGRDIMYFRMPLAIITDSIITMDIGYLGPIFGKKLHKLGPIRGVDGLGPNQRPFLSELTTLNCTNCEDTIGCSYVYVGYVWSSQFDVRLIVSHSVSHPPSTSPTQMQRT